MVLLGGEDAKQAAQTMKKLAPFASEAEIRFAIRYGTGVRHDEKLEEVQAWLTSLFPKNKSNISEALSVHVPSSAIGPSKQNTQGEIAKTAKK